MARIAVVGAACAALSIWGPTRAAAQPAGDLALVSVAGGLTGPVAVRHAGDGSGRLFVVEQAGVIRIVDAAGVLLATPFLDIAALVDDTGSEQGLLGLAFHPGYASNGLFYVNYTRDPGPGLDRTVVARYSVSAVDPDVADAGSATVILELEQEFPNHNGGDLHFGPDGYLYVSTGDGGSGGDPNNRAQSLGTLLGKLLRIDVDGSPPPAPNDLCGLVQGYAVPADNPFAGGAGDCDEIWSYGLRNPWRFSFDRVLGDLIIGDVGQGALEEIDLQPGDSGGGENWGWRCYEGNIPHNLTGCGGFGAYDAPILVYGREPPCASVTAGFRYRGHRVVGFYGSYVFADYCTGKIWFAVPGAGGSWSASLWSDTSLNVSSFGEDEQGELYAVHHGGELFRFESPSSIFADGFESGDVAAWGGAAAAALSGSR